MPRGGYREPANPAPASGPGRLSRRTDGGPAQKLRVGSGGGYGDRQEMLDLQRSAPLSNTGVEPGDPGAASVDPSQLTPLDAPTAHPNRDITYGLPSGPGPNPDDIFGKQGQMNDKDRSRLALYLPALMQEASGPEASEETRDFVRRLRADL